MPRVGAGNATSFSEQQLVDCSWGYGEPCCCTADRPSHDATMHLHAASGAAWQSSPDLQLRDTSCLCQGSHHAALYKALAAPLRQG